MESMIQLSVNTWHFKLNKWVLGNLAPNPRTMHNLCPYFWLSICSIILAVPVTVVKLIVLFFRGIAKLFSWLFIMPAQKSFYSQLADRQFQEEMAIRYFYNHRRYHPWFIPRDDFSSLINNFFSEEAKKSKEKDMTFYKVMGIWENKASIKENEEREKAKVSAPEKPKFFENVKDSISGFFDNLKARWASFKISQTKLIKYTQRFIGLVISSGMALAAYFILLYVSKGILWLIYNTTGGEWKEFLIILGIGAGVVSLIIGLIELAVWLKENFTMKPRDKFWRIMVYIFVYPIFWTIYFIFAVLLWRWILQGFIWTLFCKAIIWGSMKVFWSFLTGFTKVFKSYFGLAYSDYCPGVDWKEE